MSNYLILGIIILIAIMLNKSKIFNSNTPLNKDILKSYIVQKPYKTNDNDDSSSSSEDDLFANEPESYIKEPLAGKVLKAPYKGQVYNAQGDYDSD